jgi:hypothetical protein
MSRKERRATDARARKASVPVETAFHEAGHAVARLLTAEALGYAPEEAVHSIEIAPRHSGVSRDGRMTLISQAICMGPMVSRPLEQAVRLIIDVHEGMSHAVLWDAFAKAGTHQDREISMRSRMLVDVMGAVAEVKYLGKSDALTLFMSYACEDDRKDFARNCRTLGIAADRVVDTCDQFLQHALCLAERPSVWAAINAIASQLRATMAGAHVARLAWPHLALDPEAIAVALPT